MAGSVLLAAPRAQGQVAVPRPRTPAPAADYGEGMKLYLSADSAKYIRFMTAAQGWTRYAQNNAGTVSAVGAPQASQVDFGLRRLRLLVVSQLSDRFLLVTQLGLDSQSADSGDGSPDPNGPGKKPQLYVVDAQVEYKINRYLSLGGGLHYYGGISRLTSLGSFTLLTLDAPGTQSPMGGTIEQAGRGLGVYGKGRIGRFDYRLSINNPFLTNAESTPAQLTTGVAAFNPRSTGKVYQGYFTWAFFDQEANLLSTVVGSYLGQKRVLTAGTGFLYYPGGLYVRPRANPVPLPAEPWSIATDAHNAGVWAADVFYDMPVDTAARQQTAFTLYAAAYFYQLGPNYVRYGGTLNPGGGTDALRGNAVPIVGTGTAQTVQAGFLLPRHWLGPKLRLQPYADYIHGRYEGLRRADGTRAEVHILDAGLNLLVDGQHAKITLNYRARPDFTDLSYIRYRPEIVLQTQIAL